MRFYVIILSMLLALPAVAQEGRSALQVQLEAMQKLEPFTGHWLGEGWFTMNGERVELVQEVNGEFRLQGQMLTFWDVILQRRPGAAPRPATFGIVTYDDEAGKYLYRSYMGTGFNDYEADVPEPGVLTAQGTVGDTGEVGRLRVEIIDGKWEESAYRSRDGGETWTRIYQISMGRMLDPN